MQRSEYFNNKYRITIQIILSFKVPIVVNFIIILSVAQQVSLCQKVVVTPEYLLGNGTRWHIEQTVLPVFIGVSPSKMVQHDEWKEEHRMQRHEYFNNKYRLQQKLF